MTREFVIMPEFEKQWSAMGLSDKELSSLQYELTITPKIGDVIKERIYLITAYPKNMKENLSKEECNEIKKFVKLLEESL